MFAHHIWAGNQKWCGQRNLNNHCQENKNRFLSLCFTLNDKTALFDGLQSLRAKQRNWALKIIHNVHILRSGTFKTHLHFEDCKQRMDYKKELCVCSKHNIAQKNWTVLCTEIIEQSHISSDNSPSRNHKLQ